MYVEPDEMTLRDETRWEMARRTGLSEMAIAAQDGLSDIETVLTADQIAELDRQIGPPRGLGA